MMVNNQSALLIPSAVTEAAPLELIPVEEESAIAATTNAIEAGVRAAAATDGMARRDEHPKAHGCVKSSFEILPNLPADYAIGLFASPRTYPAWLRFSNANTTPQDDKASDGRGVGLKLLGVEGSRSGTQDLVLMNGPRFFLRDAAQALAFNRAGKNPLKFFLPSLNPFAFRLHELLAAMSITGSKMSNPLNARYWSVTPYLFGEGACKYSLIPAGAPFPAEDRTGPNFLHDNMARSLSEADAMFDFAVQLRKPNMPIEDPSIEWRERDSPFVKVARLVIPRQTFDDPERISFSENLSFTPWHGLDAHRPLGGINRVRRAVYETVSSVRHALNDAPRVEPASDETVIH